MKRNILLVFKFFLAFYAGLSDGKAQASWSERRIVSNLGGEMQVFVVDKNGDSFGHTVWLSRRSGRIKAKYFAHGNIYKRYKEFDADKRVLLVCAGAFTSKTGDGIYRPRGLTIDNGDLVNETIINSGRIPMDALVIVEAVGGVRVQDIEKNYLKVKAWGQSEDQQDQTLNLNKTEDFTKARKWASEVNATIFQTMLLAIDNHLRLEVDKAREKERERRMLALVRDSEGVLHHVVIDIPGNMYLGSAARDVLDYLHGYRGTYVYSIILLDTGMYNILQLYHLNEKPISEPTGDISPSDATNLLVYYTSDSLF